MADYALVLALALGALILAVELGRPHPDGPMDGLFLANVIAFFCFVITPFFLRLVPMEELDAMWQLLFARTLQGDSVFWAELWVLLGYMALLAGWGVSVLAAPRGAPAPGAGDEGRPWQLETARLWGAAAFFGVTGLAAMAVLSRNVGGIRGMITMGVMLRGFELGIPTAFTVNLLPFLYTASYLFFALRTDSFSPGARRLAGVLFWVMFAASLVGLVFRAGRWEFMQYLSVFPLARAIYGRRPYVRRMLVLGVVFLGVIVAGRVLLAAFTDPAGAGAQLAQMGGQGGGVLSRVLVEFTFPFAALANAVRTFPEWQPFRFFFDYPLAVAHLVPQRLIPLGLPETATELNVRLLGVPAPADLATFGYMTLGGAGVVLTFFMYGAFLRWIDRLFPARGTPLIVVVFRVAVLEFTASRIMYGDPHRWMDDGFHLIVGTLVLLLIGRRLRAAAPGPAPAGLAAGAGLATRAPA